jgi:hypothetical protein
LKDVPSYKFTTEIARNFEPDVHKESCCHEVLIHKFSKLKQSTIDKESILQKFDHNDQIWDSYLDGKIKSLFNILNRQENFTINNGEYFNNTNIIKKITFNNYILFI